MVAAMVGAGAVVTKDVPDLLLLPAYQLVIGDVRKRMSDSFSLS